MLPIWYLVFGIWYLVFGIWIWYLVFGNISLSHNFRRIWEKVTISITKKVVWPLLCHLEIVWTLLCAPESRLSGPYDVPLKVAWPLQCAPEGRLSDPYDVASKGCLASIMFP